MLSVLVINAKGGSGKTTVATNLAGYCADRGAGVLLADWDPQSCALDWLSVRPRGRPVIEGVAAHQQPPRPSERRHAVVVHDAPAAVHGSALKLLLRRADRIVVPVLPSPVDMRAAGRFIEELRAALPPGRQAPPVAVVANRARGYTNVFLELDAYLSRLSGVRYVTALRESSNYLRAAQRGLSIFEFAPAATAVDREEWKPLIRWLGLDFKRHAR